MSCRDQRPRRDSLLFVSVTDPVLVYRRWSTPHRRVCLFPPPWCFGDSEALVKGEVLFEGGPAPPSPGVRRGPHRRVTEWLGRGYGARTTQGVWSPSLPVAISRRCWPQFSFPRAVAAEVLAFSLVMAYMTAVADVRRGGSWALVLYRGSWVLLHSCCPVPGAPWRFA